jgi:hypothetical protein
MVERRKGKAVSLRGPKKGVPKDPEVKVVTFRCPPEILGYILETVQKGEEALKAKEADEALTQTDVILDAIKLDRDLSKELGELQDRLSAFAEANELNPYRDLPKVLARLVRAGLDAAQKPRKK